jgi:hypothetical protein
MQGCLAPSEIPGLPAGESSAFGHLAEDLVFADFVTRYPSFRTDVFKDSDNPAAYLFFLASKNPTFVQAQQTAFYARVLDAGVMRIPDFLVHTSMERSFYELKPDSTSGLRAGMEKVGTLSAVYPFFNLPYVPGTSYVPRDFNVANLGATLRATLRVRLAGPGLLAYKLCIDANGIIELATLAALLRYIVQQMNKQRGSGSFRPVDLSLAFQPNQPLFTLARTLGLTMAAAGAAVSWKFFWKAVATRFAVRGATAVALAAADGPLPVGDLIALGMTLWTVVDVIRLSDELWREAGRMAEEA